MSVEKKLQLLNTLLETPEESSDYHENINKAIAIFRKLLNSTVLNIPKKLQLLEYCFSELPDEALEILSMWRDGLKYYRNEDLEHMLKLLQKFCLSDRFDSQQRILTAMCLLNSYYFDIVYPCFICLCNDPKVMVNYRAEAARQLFGTQEDYYVSIAENAIQEIIEIDSLPSKYRYETIARFDSKTGISSDLNMSKIRVPYCEVFLYRLQKTFFLNLNNETKYRILSGQKLLQLEITTDSEKEMVSNVLLDISRNEDFDENIRADATDVVERLGTNDAKEEARRIRVEIGFSGANSKTVYSDSQNTHTFNAQLMEYLETLYEKTDIPPSFTEVHSKIANVVSEKYVKDRKAKYACLKALDRVSIDTATFTKYRLTLPKIFCIVWQKISTFETYIQKELINRLLEELQDMAGTCATGHADRFVNVLVGYDTEIRISYYDQIYGCVDGRLNARIRKTSSEIQGSIACGMMEDADTQDKQIMKEFVEKSLNEIFDELYNEFVKEKYVSDSDFGDYRKQIENEYIEKYNMKN